MTTLNLDDKDLEVLSAALTRMPYFQVAPLIDKIRGQIAAAESRKSADPTTAEASPIFNEG